MSIINSIFMLKYKIGAFYSIMKLNLKRKIIIYSLITNLIITISLGGTLYKYAGELYYQAFISSKESLARSIALSIDGEKHKTFTSLNSAGSKEYQKYLKYLNTIRLNEKYISYLFTISYDRKNNKLTYIVDSDINPTDIIWITTEFFGLALFIGKNNEIAIKYNETIYTEDFDILVGDSKIPLRIGKDGILTLGGRKLAGIVSRSPLTLEASGKKLSINDRELFSEIFINDKPVELYCSFTAKNESQSMPGELYAESKDVVERCKQIIDSQQDTIVRRDSQTSIYGKNITTVYSVIKDSKGAANGLVVVEIFQGEVSNFKRAVALISLIVSFLAFIFIVILTLIFAEYIIIPIKKLTKGTQKVGEGNLDYTINTNRTDEFGILADTFNSMVSNLKKAHIEITSANKELSNYKNNLELIVEERTKELKKTNMELSSAISEVKHLKGLLPICSSCKKIRDDNGYWSQLESYISTHSQAEFTHSICPVCAKKLYPDI